MLRIETLSTDMKPKMENSCHEAVSFTKLLKCCRAMLASTQH